MNKQKELKKNLKEQEKLRLKINELSCRPSLQEYKGKYYTCFHCKTRYAIETLPKNRSIKVCPVCHTLIASESIVNKISNLQRAKHTLLEEEKQLKRELFSKEDLRAIKNQVIKLAPSPFEFSEWKSAGGSAMELHFRDEDLSIHGSYGGNADLTNANLDAFERKLGSWMKKAFPDMVVEVSSGEKCWVGVFIELKI